MKSELTLRIDEELKDSAKRLAKDRGKSLSELVESYLRILTERSGSGAQDHRSGSADGDEHSLDPENLGPVTRRIAGGLDSQGQ